MICATVSENTSRGAIECLWTSNFILWVVYPKNGTHQQTMSNASSLNMTQLAGKEPNNFNKYQN